MRKGTLFFVLIMIIFSNLCAQWHWQNPEHVGKPIFDIQFTDEHTGYVCGRGGLLLKTTDGGENWVELKISGDPLILKIFFLNNETGWCLTHGDYLLYKTTDGGINWSFVSNFSPRHATTFWFLDELNGFAGGYYYLLKTNDGGLTWSEVDNTSIAYSIFFLTESVGFIGAQNRIQKTINSGNDWKFLGLSGNNLTISKIFALDTNNIFVIGSGWDFNNNVYYAFYRTSDGGDRWTGKSFGSQVTDVYFESSEKGWICSGEILRTQDGGMNWDSTGIDALHFAFEGSHSWSTGQNTISYSENGWQTSTPQISSVFSDILWDGCAIDKNNSVACGTYKTILGSKDGGISWRKYYSSPDYIHLNAVTAFSNEIWSVGQEGIIVYSKDNCNSWTEKTIAARWLSDITFLPDGTGFIAGRADSTGSIFRSTDGGENWRPENNFPNIDIVEKIKFSRDNLGWAIGNSHSIMRSTDKGLTWENVVDSIYIANNIAVCGDTSWFTYSNRVLRTTDAGNTWDSFKVFDFNNTIFFESDIDFVNSRIGYISAYDGRVFKSTNGGVNWVQEDYPGGIEIFAIDFIDEDIGWSFGYPGTILKRDPNYTAINYDRNILPLDFCLYQNYPNPFNPTTKISFSVSQPAKVSIIVYDVLGKKVTTLLNEEKSTGNYSIDFNGSNLSSGVYFYQMRVNDYTETKKMILLR